MNWELHDGQAMVGPLDEAHVLRMIASGLPATTMVRAEGETAFRPLASHPPFAEGLRRLAAAQGLPEMQKPDPVQLPSMPRPKAPIVAASTSFAGTGCLVQGLGFVVAPVVAWLAVLAVGPVGLAAGLLTVLGFLLAGRSVGQKLICGACQNPVTSREVRVCPTCKSVLF